MEQQNLHKNQKIAQSFALTKNKRLTQSCKVFTVKVQSNKLNNQQKQHLNMLFVEAKRLYNHILNLSQSQNVFDLEYTNISHVKHFDKDKNELTSPLTHLSSQMKQSVVDGIKQNIKSLSKAKEKGRKIGRLKFISEYNAINLKQKDVSYKIIGKNKIKIQGIKKPLKVNGLDQLPLECDLANAKLIKRASGYYVAVTCYVEKQIKIKKENHIGVDLGCETSVTLSNGEKINYSVEESESLKRLKRKLSKSKKGSKNRYKLSRKILRLNERIYHIKNNKANEIVNYINSLGDVVMQDEQLQNWSKNNHGKKIQTGILGRIKQGLISKGAVVLSRWVPTTKMCTCCSNVVNINQWERTFHCSICGTSEDRDVHAAQNMIWFNNNILGVERTEYKPVEFKENIRIYFDAYPLTTKQEALQSLVAE